MYRPPRRRVIRLAGAALAVGGTGVASAARTPTEPRVIFERQSRPVADPTTVQVARADLPDGGWVVIHPGDHTGHGGDGGDGAGTHSTSSDGGGGGGHDHGTLGVVGPLEPGRYGGLMVPLDAQPAPGTRTLTAMLHRDAPADGAFTHHVDRSTDPHYGAPADRDVAAVTFRASR